MTRRIEAAEKNCFRGQLGALYSREKTIFRFWQPFAEKAFLRLYDSAQAVSCSEMKRRESIFELSVKGDLEGKEYEFEVCENGKTTVFADCYSRLVNKDATRGIVTDMQKNAPAGWENDKPITAQNPVITELSVRDFSMDKSADFTNRGKFGAFCEKNVKNKYGYICGLEYIKSLGATHIQLMPVFDFDSDGSCYNWGYNPRFFNAPSRNYAVNNPILELRELVMSAHKMGIGVIADVVYNHVYDAGKSTFERQIAGYFFREENGAFSNGSGCGNEFASERKMARKFIVDSVEFLAREYHLDGFRFDLMGLIDIKTMQAVRNKLMKINPHALVYGEGWTGGKSALNEKYRAVGKNARKLPKTAFFSDSFRDAIRGNVFDISDKGFMSGELSRLEPIKQAITGISNPSQTINYAECHDNHTLYDRLRLSLKGARLDKIMRVEKMAAAFVMLSEGIAFFQLGQEFLRTKNFSSDSYNLPDSVNSIKWELISENKELCEYYRGLTAFRKRYYGIFNGGAFSEIKGRLILKNNGFLFMINPTNKDIILKENREYEVFIDDTKAQDSPLYAVKRLCCAKFSVLIARCI